MLKIDRDFAESFEGGFEFFDEFLLNSLFAFLQALGSVPEDVEAGFVAVLRGDVHRL